MQADQFSLRNLLRAVQQAEKSSKPFDRLLSKLQAQLEKSLQRREQRAVWKPRLEWDQELPVVARRQEIADAVRDHQVIVLCGETGSGKSTQLPKILIEMGRGLTGVIGHTQPRRIAARSVAARLADEMNGRLGHEIGFRIRFTDSSGPNTRVRLMTDGILLAETQTDRFLDQYDTIIIDEAHERSLNIDFLLGYLKRLLPKRRDLKVIITSATIDAARFAEHFAEHVTGERRGVSPPSGLTPSEPGTLAIVESFTGGQITGRLAHWPGAEKIVRRGIVARELTEICNAVELLNVPPAITKEAAEAVALAACKHTGATHALAVLIDLDEGGDRIEFAGTVCLAIATKDNVASRRSRIVGGRDWVRLGAVEMGLDCLRRYLQGLPVTERIDFEKVE